MATPQKRTRDLLTARGYLVGTVEKRKKFPDRKKQPCSECGNVPMIEISSDLWEIFDLVAVKPADPSTSGWGATQNGRLTVEDFSPAHLAKHPHIVFVQTTSRNNHSTRRNKILASMEAKLVLLSGAHILVQSWRQKEPGAKWQVFDEWIGIGDYAQAPHYPNTVEELMEIKRKAKLPDLPPGTEMQYEPIDDGELPF